MRGFRLFRPTALLSLLLSAAPAMGTVGPGVELRWSGSLPEPARAGAEMSGAFEIRSSTAGLLRDVRVEGEGWTLTRLELPSSPTLAAGVPARIPFTLVPTHPEAPVTVRCTLNGVPVDRTFRFDAATLAAEARPRDSMFPRGGARPDGVRAPSAATAQAIHVTGRVAYNDFRGVLHGADHVTVRVMDDDGLFDEQMWSGETDDNGYFDVNINWDDCDVLGCDIPDIYVEYLTRNGVADVVHANLLEPTWDWSTENNTLEDYGGSELAIGTLMPADTSEFGALHVYSSVQRAARVAAAEGGMAAPQVEVEWPSNATTSAKYDPFTEDIYINRIETWTEGTAIHEYAHWLHDTFGNLLASNYHNGFCDSPEDGHCTWCPENLSDGWQEGFADWFGSYVIRQYPALYGINALSINDGRYTLESLGSCQDGRSYPSDSTEGFVGALLRDIEDSQNDDHGPATDCDVDALTLGADEIFTVFRDDDPTDINMFINSFRARYPQFDMDLWSTARNVTPKFGFPLPLPTATLQSPACQVVREGETVVLRVQGNGSRLRYRWRYNGSPIGYVPGVSGDTTNTLTFSPALLADSGPWDCVVSTCDSTRSVLSPSAILNVIPGTAAQPLISWGENASGQVGDGTTSSAPRAPYLHSTLVDGIGAASGRAFSLALRADGRVEAWGHQDEGELGNGVWSSTVTTPALVNGITDAIQIAAQKYTGMALRRDGSVVSWGAGAAGQLGDGLLHDRNIRAPVSLVGCVRQIAGGDFFGAALREDGTVWMWGENDFGVLGRGFVGGTTATPAAVPSLTSIVAIAAGPYTCYALDFNGEVWSWGQGTGGQLGNGASTNSAVPVRVSGLTGIRSIAAGSGCAFAIRDDGVCFSWGSSAIGLLGDGVLFESRSTPAPVAGLFNAVRIGIGGGLFGIAQMPDGSLEAWGSNAYATFGTTTPAYSALPVAVPGLASVSMFSVGYGTVHAFGRLGSVNAALSTLTPSELSLRVSPNPSFRRARATLETPAAEDVELAVYDLSGRRVRELVHEWRPAGHYVADWDGRSDDGSRARAGVYFLRLHAGAQVVTQRILRME